MSLMENAISLRLSSAPVPFELSMAPGSAHLETLLEYYRGLVAAGMQRTNPTRMPLGLPSAPVAPPPIARLTTPRLPGLRCPTAPTELEPGAALLTATSPSGSCSALVLSLGAE